MRTCILLALTAAGLPAAVIRGTVVEYQTGHLLARALVRLDPVAGTPGEGRSVRTDRYGSFEFASLPAGDYLIAVSRRYFIPVEFGQKRWNSAGAPLAIGDADGPYLTIQMFRFGAISGTVVDENDVGLPEFEVAAYRNTRPPQLVASAKADERGMYRLYGLEPGSYLMRSAGDKSEEGSFLPTFAKETQVVEQAFPVEVGVNQEVKGINIRPMQGTTYTLSYKIPAPCLLPPAGNPPPITVTMVSDMGRKTLHSYEGGGTGLPRGDYEIFAETEAIDGCPPYGVYAKLSLVKDTSQALSLGEIRPTRFSFAGAPMNAVENGAIQILRRRKDLAGNTPAEVVQFDHSTALFAPGPWQLALAPGSGYYVSGFNGSGYGFSRQNQRFEGWNDFDLRSAGFVRFSLSTGGSIHGFVKSGAEPVVGVPVFLEPSDLPRERRVTELYAARTDLHGMYRIAGLPPGNYRLLSTWEYQKPDEAVMTAANAPSVKLDPGSDIPRDLDLYVIR